MDNPFPMRLSHVRLAALLAITCTAFSTSSAPTRPNLIFLHLDDQDSMLGALDVMPTVSEGGRGEGTSSAEVERTLSSPGYTLGGHWYARVHQRDAGAAWRSAAACTGERRHSLAQCCRLHR